MEFAARRFVKSSNCCTGFHALYLRRLRKLCLASVQGVALAPRTTAGRRLPQLRYRERWRQNYLSSQKRARRFGEFRFTAIGSDRATHPANDGLWDSHGRDRLDDVGAERGAHRTVECDATHDATVLMNRCIMQPRFHDEVQVQKFI